MIESLKKLIDGSSRILVTSHIAPDPDAISSALLLAGALDANYPDKTIKISLEEKPDNDLSFLSGYSNIQFNKLLDTVSEFKPELLIITDANTYKRVSRFDFENLKQHVLTNGIKTLVIDHHEEDGTDKFDLVINNKRPATAEEVYALMFEDLKLKKSDGFAETTLLGIISDTQRHKFDHPGYRETYRIISALIDAGASIEKLESKIEQYNQNELEALAHLLSNISNSGKGYTYSYIDDDFFKDWQTAKKPTNDLKKACDLFSSQFIRNFEGNQWGFTIYPDILSGHRHYGVSLRSISGVRDVSAIARQLGGGGHKPAAGVKLIGNNIAHILEQVENAIELTL